MEAVKQSIKNFLQKNYFENPLIVLLGPTASGKTALSLKLAREFNGEIVSADSRQVYLGLTIGTDKILESEREGIPHHLIDVTDPDKRFTVSDFKKMAEEKIDDILARGRIPFLVGGTGLYIRAVTDNFQIPETKENFDVRNRLEKEVQEKGSEFLYERLQKVDPESAQKISKNNPRYIIRALEIYELTGRKKYDQKGVPKYKVLKIGLNVEKPVLDARISERVERQFERGLQEEVKRLLEKYPSSLPSLQTIGYQELVPVISGKIPLETAKEEIKKHTSQFARRQMTWFKREKDIHWLENLA